MTRHEAIVSEAPSSAPTRAESIAELYRKHGFKVLDDDGTAFVIGMSGLITNKKLDKSHR